MKFTTIISSIVGIFIAGLGFGYTLTIEPWLVTNQNEDTNIFIVDVVEEYLKDKPLYEPKYEDRIIIHQ